tara:strand:+ start:903 stop:1244 length:342 start_codon:yes stop_codon:yes gene_type:complete
MTTIFSKIINKEIKADIVYEDSESIAFVDINGQAPVHILIIPKREISSLNTIKESDKELLGHLLFVANKIAKKFNISESGYRIVCNCNDDGGQSVYHLHFHLLGGRKLSWPPG